MAHSKDRQTFARQIYAPPLQDMPKALREFAEDSRKVVKFDYTDTIFGELERRPHVRQILLAVARLLRTMKKCAMSTPPRLLETFSLAQAIATSYFQHNSSVNSILLALPTGYLAKAMDEVAKEAKMDAETKADASRISQ